jgi:RHS repeat-associated protein
MKVNEIAGYGNHYVFRYREYDPRLGRFWSEDPLTSDYPWYTPYQFAGNKVINCIDIEGLEEWNVINPDGSGGKEFGPYANRDKAQEAHTDKLYKSYNKNVDCESYNCAGLALRNYEFLDLNELRNILSENAIDERDAKTSDVKITLWTYFKQLIIDGQPASDGFDFHVVGSQDPNNVFSKDGVRPVYGPDRAEKFTPRTGQGANYDRRGAPAFDDNRMPIWVVRKLKSMEIFYLPRVPKAPRTKRPWDP